MNDAAEVKMLSANTHGDLEKKINELRKKFVILGISHASNNKGSITEYTAAVTVKAKANTLTEGN